MVAHDLVQRAERLVHQQQVGSNESARAIEARCCMPPESCQGNLLLEAGQVHQREVAFDALLRSGAENPMISSGSFKFFSMVRHGNSAGAWNT